VRQPLASEAHRGAHEYSIHFPASLSELTRTNLVDLQIDLDSLNERSESGDLIGLYYWKDQVVHRSLVQTRGTARMEGDPRAFRLNGANVYIHYCYTAPQHRGKGLYSTMLRHIANANALQTEVKEVLIACRSENHASIRGIRSAGFEYRKSSCVIGALGGRVRLRRWYLDPDLAHVPVKASS
jgi:hypothetical protein